MKKLLAGLFFLGLVLGFTGIYLYKTYYEAYIISPLSKKTKVRELPLKKYSFESLRKIEFKSSPILIEEILKEDDEIVSHLFFFYVMDPSTDSMSSGQASSGLKKVSGLITIPKRDGKYPLIVMVRGFVDKSVFTTGEGTRRSAEEIARNGFITLAPDFLGYGKSDNGSNNSLEDRFQTYTTIISLLSSLENLNSGLDASYSARIRGDVQKIGIWGHSNGGQIALSVLAITGRRYPTVLWNPVSKPFPYSILYYTDDFEDHGKALRKVVADFEKDYDAQLYSPANYYKWIKSPLQLHQAEQDEAVPLRWSDQLYEHLKTLEKDIEYFTYPSENHNFLNGEWPVAIQRSVQFYRHQFSKNDQ